MGAVGTRVPQVPHFEQHDDASRSHAGLPPQVPQELGVLLSRRQVLKHASLLSLGGLVVSALPVADRILAGAEPAQAAVSLTDGTLQAVADTLIPGRPATRPTSATRSTRRRSPAFTASRAPSRQTRWSSTTAR